jgi:hypothetical protein
MKKKFELLVVLLILCSVKAISQDVNLDSLLDSEEKAKRSK